jgi:DNA-directed RNA polymerase specialized sigma24 family protein
MALLYLLVGYVGIGFKYLHDEDTVHKAFNEAFTALCKNIRLGKFENRNNAKVSTYFYRIFVNKCINHIPKKENEELVTDTHKQVANFYNQFDQKYVAPHDKFYDILTEKYWEESETVREEWTKQNINDLRVWRNFKKQSPLYADYLCKKYFDNWSNADFVVQKLYPNKNTAASSLSQALKAMMAFFND